MNICEIEGCVYKVAAKGYCYSHYVRMIRGMNVNSPINRHQKNRGCKIKGCPEPHAARGYCKAHYHKNIASKGVRFFWRETKEREPEMSGKYLVSCVRRTVKILQFHCFDNGASHWCIFEGIARGCCVQETPRLWAKIPLPGLN